MGLQFKGISTPRSKYQRLILIFCAHLVDIFFGGGIWHNRTILRQVWADKMA